MKDNSKIAILLVRGITNTHPDVKMTLDLLRLRNKNVCVVLDNNEINRGMVQRVKDYTTYGTINEAFFKLMLDKRGEMVGKTKVSEDKKVDTAKIAKEYFAGTLKLNEFEAKYKVKPFFRMAPPVGGYERKGIKMPFARGGVLGNRGDDKMSILLTKMLEK